MKAITLRNIPPELARVIRRRATKRGTSINRTVIQLLEESLQERNTRKQKALYHDLDWLAGSWTAEEAAAFDEALAEQRAIDAELWK